MLVEYSYRSPQNAVMLFFFYIIQVHKFSSIEKRRKLVMRGSLPFLPYSIKHKFYTQERTQQRNCLWIIKKITFVFKSFTIDTVNIIF